MPPKFHFVFRQSVASQLTLISSLVLWLSLPLCLLHHLRSQFGLWEFQFHGSCGKQEAWRHDCMMRQIEDWSCMTGLKSDWVMGKTMHACKGHYTDYITTLTFFLEYVWWFVATPRALLRFPGYSVSATNFVPRVRQRCQEVVEDPKKTILVPVLQRQKEESNIRERLCQDLSLKLLYFRGRRICIWLCNNLFFYNRLFYGCLLS